MGSTKSGSVSVISQLIIESRMMRIIKAKERPITRALLRCWGGSLLARIAIKIRLSIPNITSNNRRITSDTHTDGSINDPKNTSMILLLRMYGIYKGMMLTKMIFLKVHYIHI